MNSVLLLLIVLLVMAAFFSAAETSFTGMSLITLKKLQKRNPGRAERMEKLYNRPETVITTLLICAAAVNTTIPVLSTALAIQAFGDVNIGVLTAILTLIILIFAEITPKQIAILGTGFVFYHVFWPVQILVWILRPVSLLLDGFSSVFRRLSGKKSRDEMSVESLLSMVKHAEDTGLVEQSESNMIRGVFRIADVSVKSVMTHRTEVFSLDQNLSIREVLPIALEKGFARIPVFDSDSENITGIVFVMELTRCASHGNDRLLLKHVKTAPIYVHETWSVRRVFNLVRQSRVHLAVVLDEYGGLAGIASIMDLAEAVMGEISTELETASTNEPSWIHHLADSSWRIECETPLFRVDEKIGSEFSIECGDPGMSLGGFLEHRSGRIPETGDEITTSYGVFTIEETSNTRIISVRFKPSIKV